MNARDHTPNASANDLSEDVKEELLRRVQNLPNETKDKAFDELQRWARERNRPKPACVGSSSPRKLWMSLTRPPRGIAERNAALEQRFLDAARETANRIVANPPREPKLSWEEFGERGFRGAGRGLFCVVNDDNSIVVGALHGRQHFGRLRGRSRD